MLLRWEWNEVRDRIDGGINEYRLRYSFTVPVNAPSGDYYVSILNGSCETGIVPVAPPDCEAKGEAHNVTVLPSYIVTVIDGLKIDGNAEPTGNHLAEMRFTFISFSGVPSIEGNVTTALVINSGAYPGRVSGAGHLTNADGTIHEMQLPVFTGREDLMLFAECEVEFDDTRGGRRPSPSRQLWQPGDSSSVRSGLRAVVLAIIFNTRWPGLSLTIHRGGGGFSESLRVWQQADSLVM